MISGAMADCFLRMMGLFALLLKIFNFIMLMTSEKTEPYVRTLAGVNTSLMMFAAAKLNTLSLNSEEESRRLWASCKFENLKSSRTPFQCFSVRRDQSCAAVKVKAVTPVDGKNALLSGLAWMQDDDACPCCLEAFEGQSQVAVLPCGHVFHETCIAAWSVVDGKNADSCPSCRAKFDSHLELGTCAVL
mmetsp:Transcript_42888/g.79996  ORF Transcript_42888/g.79996 Transcript_42888/m.79996 type:complete len:189 (+) Transcript_42888:77-643(+)